MGLDIKRMQRRPFRVDAVQYRQGDESLLMEWLVGHQFYVYNGADGARRIFVDDMSVPPGWWIVRTEDDELLVLDVYALNQGYEDV